MSSTSQGRGRPQQEPLTDTELHDALLHRALLLIYPTRLEDARRILASMARDDVDSLMARIDAERSRDRSVLDHLRGIRCQLQIDTALHRAGAYAIALWLGVYGAWQLVGGAIYASASGGLAAENRTKVHVDARYRGR